MTRRLGGLFALLALLSAAGYGAYECWPTPQPPAAETPVFEPISNAPVAADRFAELARTDPVGMLAEGLSEYARTVKGFTATLEKQEQIGGKSHPPEVIRLAVQGDVPATPGEKPNVRVRMNWDAGARKAGRVVVFSVLGALYAEGENKNQLLSWRPDAVLKEYSVDPKDSDARSAARYCIRDTGLYQVMLRTHAVWKRVRDEHPGEFRVEYVGDGPHPVEKLGGRVCHVVRRISPRVELDAFALDEQPPTDPAVIERDGFDSVTIYVDAETRFQVGTELRRGDKLVGAYYYRDLVVNPAFPPDAFTPAGLKAAAKK